MWPRLGHNPTFESEVVFLPSDLWEHVQKDGATYIRFKNGVKMFWQRTALTPPPVGERGKIMDQSRTSRHRAAFDLGNAECIWVAMICLTWGDEAIPTVKQVKAALMALRKAWRKTWGEGMDAWIMEIQPERGVPHFHIFIAGASLVGQTVLVMPTETFVRKGRERRIVRGSFDKWIVETWLRCTDQEHSEDAIKFNEGGICELFDSPDAAGRYVAKESCKRAQKELPDRYAEGLGRWWYLNRKYKPMERARGAVVGEWPFEGPMKHVWEVAKVENILGPENNEQIPPGARVYDLRRDRGFPFKPLKLPEGQEFFPGWRRRIDDVRERESDEK